MKKILLAVLITCLYSTGYSQFLMDMIDTSKETGKGMLAMYKKFDHLKIGGYIQPQFQLAGEKGIKSFEGGDFAARVSNRMMLRRSRVRIDYVHFGSGTKPGVQIVFQFDANERGFTVRDVWGRVFENKWHLFSFTTGMFARPFGFEVNLSSADRESPERGRMSQLLMKSERDLGAMITLDSRKTKQKPVHIKVDLGVFNGQGINASGEFDNTKDIIARVSLKPLHLTKRVVLSCGASVLKGGLLQNTKYVFRTANNKLIADSAAANLNNNAPRTYYGADVQVKYTSPRGLVTECRAEYIGGTQSGTINNSETPTALLAGTDGFQVRNFNGAYFYFLQHIANTRHQLLLKYDWYDPNIKVKGTGLQQGSGLTAANIKYHTLGGGYINYLSDNLKLVLYYARVINETTGLTGYTADLKDDVFTCRLQFRF